MAKFKVGDRVRVLEDEGKFLVAGEVGKVVSVDYTGNDPSVEIESENPSYDDGVWHTCPDNLELVEESAENSGEKTAARILQNLNDLLEMYTGKQPMLRESILKLTEAYLDQVKKENK